MFIFGYRLIIWTGLLAAVFIFPAVAAVYLGRRYRQITRGRWHQKLARIGMIFAFLHVVLAVLQVFFFIYI